MEETFSTWQWMAFSAGRQRASLVRKVERNENLQRECQFPFGQPRTYRKPLQ